MYLSEQAKRSRRNYHAYLSQKTNYLGYLTLDQIEMRLEKTFVLLSLKKPRVERFAPYCAAHIFELTVVEKVSVLHILTLQGLVQFISFLLLCAAFLI